MCGIIGFSGSKEFDINKIKTLFLFNASRGTDGCGMYNDGKITKTDKDIYESIVKWDIKPEKMFMGHTRKSSTFTYKGAKHAHPFQSGNIIGIHNGTLANQWQIGNHNDIPTAPVDTDSEMLFKLIEKNVANLKLIKGTASIIYTDISIPNTLFCFRKNDDRPLWRGKADEGMYFSSMKESLECIGCTNIEELKIKTLYAVVDGKIITTSKYLDEEIPTRKTVTNQSAYMMSREFEDEYNDVFQRENHGIEVCSRVVPNNVVKRRMVAHKFCWMKVIGKDDSCNDNHGRILLGDYVQTADELQDDTVYVRVVVHTDENGHEVKYGKYKTILYKASCLTPLMVDTVNVFAMAMDNGTKHTMKGDIVYVREISYPNGIHDENAELLYDHIYPEESIKRAGNNSIRWQRNHFRFMERSELYQLWKKEKEKTPDKIKDYLSDHYTDVLAELCPEKIKSLVPIVNINKNSKPSDINTCLEEISKIDGKFANSLIKQIHEQMVDNKDLITAFNNVMSLDNKVNTSKDTHCAEEEDINIDIDTPPHDVAIVPYNTNTDDEISVFGDNINEKILSTVWMEVGDCVDYITNIKNGIQNMANALSDIYNDGVDLMNILNSNQVSGEATDFEDTQMFRSIAIASQMVDELSEDIDKVIEATLENYAHYDPTYKKQ